MAISATEAKNRFGYYMEQAQRQPVIVEKTGRKAVVILDHAEYERLQAIEDRYWAEKAAQAEQSGYAGPEKVMASINQRMNAE